MFAVYKKTLKQALGRVPVLVALAGLLLSGGGLAAIFNLNFASADISYAIRILVLPAFVFLSLLSLFLFAPQDPDGYDLWLRSLPLSPVSVVLGRFAAALTLFAIPTSLFLICPPVFSFFGTVNFPTAYLSLLGYCLTAAFLLSLLQAVLCRIRSPLWRTLLSFIIPLALYVWNLICRVLPLSDDAYRICTAFSPLAVFESFTYGYLYLPGIFYFLSLTVFTIAVSCFLYADTSFNAKNNRRRISLTVLSGTLLLVLICNAVVSLLPKSATLIDVTGTDVFTVSGTSKDAVRALERDVTIHYLVEGGEEEADRSLLHFLNKYAALNDRITVKVVNTERDQQFVSQYSTETLNDHSMVITSDTRHYVILASDLYHYYNAELDQNFSSEYYTYCLQAYQNYNSSANEDETPGLAVQYGSVLALSASTTAYFDGDALIVNAIRYVASDEVPTVYVFSGTENGPDQTLVSYLTARGYFLKNLLSLRSVPKDCDLLLIYSPTVDLSSEETEALKTYLAGGGKCFLATSCAYTNLPNLFSVSGDYGLGVLEHANIVGEKNSSTGEYDQNFYAAVAAHAATGNFDGKLALLVPHAITVTQTEGVNTTSWITTTAEASLKFSGSETYSDQVGKYTCAAIAEKGETKLGWISSVLSLGSTGHYVSNGGNYELLLSAFDWMTDQTYTALTISSVALPSQTLALTSGQASIGTLILVVAFPAAVLLPLAIRLYTRRKKQ